LTSLSVPASVVISRPALASQNTEQEPVIHDDEMTVQVQSMRELKFPTSMAFLGPDDILVLEKNEGTVNRIVNGEMLPEPLLDVNVSTEYERGMLVNGLIMNGIRRESQYVFHHKIHLGGLTPSNSPS
jgi:hypothetical protein